MRSWRNTSTGRKFLLQWRPTSAGVTHVRGIIPSAMHPTACYHDARILLESSLKKSQIAKERSANRKLRAAPSLQPSDKVWLLRRHVASTRPSAKLDVRRLGPFPVIGSVGSSAFRLELPPSIRIHPVFHVALLEPYVENPIPGRDVPQPPPVIVDGDPEWEVASVLDSKFLRGKL